jgi:SRSO17 transposase
VFDHDLPVARPLMVPLATLARVAGTRWRTEENFAAGKGLTRLDEYQARTWTSWHRWVTLAMLALAFLTITAAAEHAHPRRPG